MCVILTKKGLRISEIKYFVRIFSLRVENEFGEEMKYDRACVLIMYFMWRATYYIVRFVGVVRIPGFHWSRAITCSSTFEN